MKFSAFFLSFSRRVVTWLVWLAGTAILLFAIIAATIYFWLLPNIADHRDTLADLMSKALGQRVSLEAVSGVWEQTRPQISLRGVRLYDQQNRPALYLEHLDAALAWRSLVVLQPRFSRLELTAPALTVRRARDGHFYVGGIPVNPADTRSGFSDWLLKQNKVHISRATLAWRDELRGAPTLVLRDLDFALQNRFNKHWIKVSATPPASLSTPIWLSADLKGRSTSDFKTWSGVIRGSVAGASLAQFSQWIDLPYKVARGWGATNVRLDIKKGQLTGASAGLNVRDISISLGRDVSSLKLRHLRGNLDWKHKDSAQSIELQAAALTLADNTKLPAFNVGITWKGGSHEVHARNLSLSGLQNVWPALPMPRDIHDSIRNLRPRGHIDDLQLSWQGTRPSSASFILKTRFSNIQIAPSGSRPGISNLYGIVRGDNKSGVFELQGKAMQFNLPKIFREVLTLDSLQTRGVWKKGTQGTLLTVNQLTFANADAAGSAQGSYETVKNHPGKINVTGRLTRGNGPSVYRYLPRAVHDDTVKWLQRAIVSGISEDTRLTLKGDLAHFPFVNDQGGVFKIDVAVKNAVLDYAEGWPRIEDASGRLEFYGSHMEMQADEARIFNTRLGPVTAVIADLHKHDNLIEITGQAVGDAEDFIRYSNVNAVKEKLHGVSEGLEGTGIMALALNLKIPLHHGRDTTLGGRLSFRGNTLLKAGLPRLDQVKGDLVFTHNTLSAQGLSAQMLGGPISISASARNGRTQLQAQGRLSAASLSAWLDQPWSKRLSGEAQWRGQITLNPESTQVRIESDLVGLESRLPAPLNKPAVQSMPLVVTQMSQPGQEQITEIQLDRTLGAIWQTTADNRISRGELRFEGTAKLPQEPGLRLAGSGRGLALSEWMRLMPDAGGTSELQLSTIDLSFGTLDLMGRRFPDVRVQGRNRGGLLRLAVSGRDMNGMVSYRPAEPNAVASSARLSAQFKQLSIPAAEGGGLQQTSGNIKANEIPTLDLTVEDFRLGRHALGRLEATAHGSPQGMVIENLQLTHPDSVFHMSGLWRDTGLGETQARLQVEVLDAGRLLSRFDFKDAIKHGSVNLDGNVTWEGSPADFGFQTLAGTINLRARNGQFLKVEPGVAKLLGVLSLQSLPRRLSFDFRDIFNDGFAFDEISATMLIARGVVYSDDLRMKGPSAKVAMTGMAKLTDETVQLRVKVTPKLSEGVAVAGALLGGPLAGLGVLAAQKLLRDPFEEASSREYMVTGPWREPDVTRLTKTGKEAN